jgi:biopolymer transport protein ExbD
MARHKKTDPGTEVTIPIVPMLDLSFQILFFFVVTFDIGQQEGYMAMNLPASGEAKAKDQSQVDLSKQSDVELEVPSDFVVVAKSYDTSFTLSLRDAEKIAEVGAIKDMDKMTPDNQRKAFDEVFAKLTDMLKSKLADKKKENANSASNVKIEANGGMKYSHLVSVMDACIKAGYSQVGFAPPPDLGQQ